MRLRRLHVVGASGAGTSTLGAALAEALDAPHIDADDYYWQRTDPPFTRKREPSARIAAIRDAIGAGKRWVMSGSIVSWGHDFFGEFTHVIFLSVDPALRMVRLREREATRYGRRIAPGGDMHDAHLAFMRWAESYDTAPGGMRCRAVHEDWMVTLACPVIRLDSARPVCELVTDCIEVIESVNRSA